MHMDLRIRRSLPALCGLMFAATPAASAQAQRSPDGVELIDVAHLRALADSLTAARTGTGQLGKRDGMTWALTRRDSSGGAEVHLAWTDVFVVQSGSATVEHGGTLNGGRESTPGELRAASIAGGTRVALHPGDMLVIPAGAPHQMLLRPDERIAYVAFKVASAPSASSSSAASAASVTPASARRHVAIMEQAARPEDVATIDGLMRAFYGAISGPKGEPRQWPRDRSLYVPGVRFVMAGVARDGRPAARTVTHQEYVDLVDSSFVDRGLFEHETGRCVRRFGNVAQLFSAYEIRETPEGPVTARGVNVLQLYREGDRWWVSSVMWDDARANNPIPTPLCRDESATR